MKTQHMWKLAISDYIDILETNITKFTIITMEWALNSPSPPKKPLKNTK